MVVDGGVGAAAGRAGEGDGRDAGAGAAHQELRAGADEGRLGRPGAEAEAGRELLAHRAEDRRRVVRGGGADDHLAGQHDLLHLPRRDPRCRLLDRGFEGAAAAGRCGSSGGRSGAGRAAAGSRRRAGRRGAPPAPPPRRSASSPGPTTALTVRKAVLPAATDRDLGQEERAGLERAPGRRAAALGVEGEAAEPDRPGAGGQPARLVDDRVAPRLRRPSAATSAKRRAPARGRPRAPPPSRPARNRGRAAPSRTSGRSPAGRRRSPRSGSSIVDRGGDADQRPPSPALCPARAPRGGTHS